MGRVLASGLLSSIFIRKRSSMYSVIDLKKEFKNVLKEMDKIIDTSKYDIIEKENAFIMYLKPDFVNENIHDLLKEMDVLTPIHLYYDGEDLEVDVNDKDFKKKVKLNCKVHDYDYSIIYEDEEIITENRIFYPLDFFLYSSSLIQDIEIKGAILTLWSDFNKYDGEDETMMLEIINTMKTTYYHTELSKVLIYEIIG